MRAAVLQLNTTADVRRNVQTAVRLIDEAAAEGAELLVLPEKFNYLGEGSGVASVSQPLDGELMEILASAAARHAVYLVAGSMWEQIPGEKRTYNTSVLLAPDGRRVAYYRKIHMFDVDVGGEQYRESDDCRPGSEVVAAELNAGFILGLSICYDLRFPELYRELAGLGAWVVTVPAAFTMATGKDHWEVLLRARAVENQMYVVAANQFGMHGPGRESYGRSLIVDPWGVVLARAADGEGIAFADLDFTRLGEVRKNLPSFENRAPEAYACLRVAKEIRGDSQ